MRVRSVVGSVAAVAVLAAGCGRGPATLTTQVTASSEATAGPSAAPATSLTPVPMGSLTATAGTATATPVRVSLSPAPASSAPPPADPAHLTLADSGQTIHVAVGQEVQVELPGGSNGGYHQPVSSTGAVQRTSASGGYPTDQPARATFVATRAGTVDLTSDDDFACLHDDPPCLPAQRRWVVHVVVP